MNILAGIQSTAAALNAERIRMDVISENIANVNTTRSPDGGPYQRRQVVFETVLRDRLNSDAANSLAKSVQVSRIEKDQRPPLMIYNPGSPDADERGMVAMPNINIHEEMVDMIASSRAFEANLAVIKNARAMAMQTLAIGKR